ncbi:Cas10/Cmr2 second palm domain-containing protein [Tessaracoccus defluvii]|uniref:Cas10/Cmr2 second palm domain-containing protein n=1 Tax=Tessaracoccus defluvii TaxID=1285901 RepID=UPI0031E191FA
MFYASVGVKQIQAHLARSRHLWGRRGASDMLFYLTDISGVADDIPVATRGLRTVREILEEHPGVVINIDSVDTDGVVQLQGPGRSAVEAAARAIAHNLKLHLPAASVETSIREAASSVAVLRAEREGEPASTTAYPPTVIEFPLAHHCDECSSAMASREVRVREQLLRLCGDCAARNEGPRNETLRSSATVPTSGFMVEQRMLRSLQLTQVQDFKQLAGLGQLPAEEARRTTTNNHIATVFADGNGLGGLFGHLRDEAIRDGSTRHLLEVSKRIKQATENGLRAAIETSRIAERDGKVMAAIPHILGGDDVLVSVPATRVWTFLITFMTTMQQLLGEDPYEEARSISFSAGVVICHQAFPIGDQVELAERLLRQAKWVEQGQEWTFAWQDVTNEGSQPLERVVRLDEWPRHEALMEAARHIGGEKGGNTARATLRAELRLPDIGARTLRLRHLADRMEGAEDLFNLAFGQEWRDEPVTDAHTRDLLGALSIMRWLP